MRPAALVVATLVALSAGCLTPRPVYATGGIRVATMVRGFVQRGTASFYGPGFHGRRTASGETFDMNAMTCAHRTLPFGTVMDVENLDNGRSVTVRVNDRGPYISGRIVDLSRAAAEQLGMISTGTAEVLLRVTGVEEDD